MEKALTILLEKNLTEISFKPLLEMTQLIESSLEIISLNNQLTHLLEPALVRLEVAVENPKKMMLMQQLTKLKMNLRLTINQLHHRRRKAFQINLASMILSFKKLKERDNKSYTNSQLQFKTSLMPSLRASSRAMVFSQTPVLEAVTQIYTTH